MQNYYFTFGQAHYTKAGEKIHNYWVRVVARSWQCALILFIEKFTSVYMNKPEMFSVQYGEQDFNYKFYPKGEFMVFKQAPIQIEDVRTKNGQLEDEGAYSD